ncbi:MAG TPA: hypothetical protein DIC34_01110 [Treponema sp.]|nr:hypothetical protein [Treponema sp.]
MEMERVPSVAAQIIITVIPIVGIVMGSTVAFFYLLWNHKRTVLLIQAGRWERPDFDLLSFCLLAGLLLTFVGLSLTVLLALLDGFGYGLLGGVLPLSIGLSLLAYYGAKRGDRAA